MKAKLKGYLFLVLAYGGAFLLAAVLGRTIIGAVCNIICASLHVQWMAYGITQAIMRLLIPIFACIMIYFKKLENEADFAAFEKQVKGKGYSLKSAFLDSFKSVDVWGDIATVTLMTVLVWSRFTFHRWMLLNIPIYTVFAFASNVRIHVIWNNTIKDPSTEDNGGKRRNKLQIEEHELGSVARARAYGGTRRVGFLDRFNEAAAHFLYIIYRGWAILVLSLYALILIGLLETIGVVISALTVLFFIFLKLKLPRKRLKLYRRVRRVCKRRGYRMTVKRSALRSLRYTEDGYDFSVDTGKDVYHVRVFTVSKNNSRMTFNDKNNVNVVTPCPRSNRIVTVKNGSGNATVRTYEARGFGIMRIKGYTVEFPPASELSYKAVHNVLLVNLTPFEMHKKGRDGGVVPTGTGEDMGDYVIYTANDFVTNLLDIDKPHYQSDSAEIGH